MEDSPLQKITTRLPLDVFFVGAIVDPASRLQKISITTQLQLDCLPRKSPQKLIFYCSLFFPSSVLLINCHDIAPEPSQGLIDGHIRPHD
jgi:hypothetical protein